MKKIIMLGTAKSAYEIDWDDPNVEYWGLGSCFSHKEIKRIDVGFEIHKPEFVESIQIKKKKCNYDRFGDVPIYVQDADNSIIKKYFKNPKTYPLNEMLEFVNNRRYFTCSWAYMIPFAVMQGYKEIEIAKVSLSSDQEFVYEKPCIEYWCDIMSQKHDVKISIPDDSYISWDTKLYGYEERATKYKAVARNKFLWSRYNMIMQDYTKKLILYGEAIGTQKIIDMAMSPQAKEHLVNIARQIKDKPKTLGSNIQELRENMKLHEGCLQAEIFYNELLM